MPPLQWIWVLYFFLRPKGAVHLTDQALCSLALNNWTQPPIIVLAKAVAELWADGLERAGKSLSQSMEITEIKISFSKAADSS